MKLKTGLVLGTTVSLLILVMATGYGQEPTVTESAVPEVKTESDVEWLWGEVVSVDAAKNEITVKYLDYETDQEKEMTLTADEKTAYENIKSIAEVKPKDTVSIDYTLNPEGKSIAKNISVEKSEGAQSPQEVVPVEQPETTSATPQPQ
jgi:hypothetical protein